MGDLCREAGREFLCRRWEAGLAWLGASGTQLWLPFAFGGSPEPSAAGRGSWFRMKVTSEWLLATGLESVIFLQIFNQEAVRQEKIRQDRRTSKTIQIVSGDKAAPSILL